MTSRCALPCAVALLVACRTGGTTPPKAIADGAVAADAPPAGSRALGQALVPGCPEVPGIPYAQELANPRRNSLSTAAWCASLAPAITLDPERQFGGEWLVAGDDPQWVASGSGRFTNLRAARPPVDRPNSMVWAAVPGGRWIGSGPDGIWAGRIGGPSSHEVSIEAVAGPTSGWVKALFPTPSGFIGAFQYQGPYQPCPPGRRCRAGPMMGGTEVARHDFRTPPGDQTKALWTARLPECLGAVAFMANGSAVVPCPTALRVVDASGHEQQPWDLTLDPLLVALDLEDHVLGFSRAGDTLELVRVDATGAKRLRLSTTQAVQPPVVLPDDRVVVVGVTEITSIRRLAVEWTASIPVDDSLPGGWGRDGAPRAVATRDGKLVLKAAGSVHTFDERGALIWSQRCGSPIKSGPVLTNRGGICVGTLAGLRCWLPGDS
ncbi:MAG: hypothetical protein JW751_00780 [Polyangiaceae bacterium]|nr:hypothetical protein [Polyangiaceae bacterium]